ncbi:hypothetical protein [Litchfieldia alkalitelluris]|uniref:hypothetical protein n=1 Tax=Litchfieldia alkalitelluris TaxID=304268 RepID=UPI00099648E4|nr:hypothetical protein [Litchfieldia alkalitelluris]
MANETENANMKINQTLEDSQMRTEGHDIEQTNQKLNDEFYEGSDEGREIAPTYMNNNTPAIRISGKPE